MTRRFQASPVEFMPSTPEAASLIPTEHQINLERIKRISSMVGGELGVAVINPDSGIPPRPGVYLFDDGVDFYRYSELSSTSFALAANALSGKVDSAHTVLPGTLSFTYSAGEVGSLPVANKLYRKRSFLENLHRVQTEVRISRIQQTLGELAFDPVAVAIASIPYDGKGTDFRDYDILLVTRFGDAIFSLDNLPWHVGFTGDNMDSATAAILAIARFNTRVGIHGDTKVKNIAQHASGKTSLIDFETSTICRPENPSISATIAHEDVGSFFNSLNNSGFFRSRPEKAPAVIDGLAEAYLDLWNGFSIDIHDAVLGSVTAVAEAVKEEVKQSAKPQMKLPGHFIN